MRAQYEALAGTSGITPDPRLMSDRATEDELHHAIGEIKAERVDVVSGIQRVFDSEIRLLRDGNFVGSDGDIIDYIQGHMALVRDMASDKITFVNASAEGKESDYSDRPRILFGVNIYLIWGRGMIRNGVVGIPPAMEALESWPVGVRRVRKDGKLERLVDAQGNSIVPGLNYLMSKRVPGMLRDLTMAMVLRNKELQTLTVNELKRVSGRDFGLSSPAWHKWWQSTKDELFQIAR